MKRILLSVIVMLLTFPFESQCQNYFKITGTIRSSVDSSGLAGIDVQVLGTPRVDVSDSVGHYTIFGIPNGTQKLRAFGIEYGLDTEVVYHPGQTTYVVNLFLPLSHCEYDSTLAQNNIFMGTLTLLLTSGGIVSPNISKEDIEFQKRYGFTYIGLGCSRIPMHCMCEYNQVILGYMDKKFGSGWRKGLRSDVALQWNHKEFP